MVHKPSYNQLRHGWYSYLELLDIDYSAGSSCPECGPVPAIVVCDATAVAFKKKMVVRPDSTTDSTKSASLQTGR